MPDGFIALKKEAVLSLYSLDDIVRIHSSAPELCQNEIDECLDIIDKDNPEHRYRGKFHWNIFSFIISYLIDDANNIERRVILSDKVKFNFSRNDKRKFFEETYHFSKMPDCLNFYIDKLVA